MKSDRPSDWDWVTARHDCTTVNFFERLYLGAKLNVETRNKQRGGSAPVEIAAPQPGSFSIIRALSFGGHVMVRFNLRDERIMVQGSGIVLNFEGTLTLNNDGECRLLVGGDVLDEWQVLRKALETLLFMPDS